MIDVDGYYFVTWKYRDRIICPVCRASPDATSEDMNRRMKVIREGGDREGWSGCLKCEGCGLEVIVDHTLTIDYVEVKT